MNILVKKFFKQLELEDVTPFAVSEITGISSTCLYAWRSEHRNPSLENFIKVLEVIGWQMTIGPSSEGGE